MGESEKCINFVDVIIARVVNWFLKKIKKKYVTSYIYELETIFDYL